MKRSVYTNRKKTKKKFVAHVSFTHGAPLLNKRRVRFVWLCRVSALRVSLLLCVVGREVVFLLLFPPCGAVFGGHKYKEVVMMSGRKLYCPRYCVVLTVLSLNRKDLSFMCPRFEHVSLSPS
eukprot:Hpha_TRINITY_DN78_c0_g1::TRINITY_DN78_c0_g1_i1::g.110051::m.110051